MGETADDQSKKTQPEVVIVRDVVVEDTEILQRARSNSTYSSADLETAITKTGMILSGMLWGFLSDAFGRKKLLVLGFLLDALMNVLAGAFPILSLMILFKFLAGF
ncbi:putative transporter svop-1, partial [Halyomorpha halys]|uniref:putative transporter svop-1 n=1 Tax=Halyomorpha halys TaxID=286706 RepID=UPI0006D5143F